MSSVAIEFTGKLMFGRARPYTELGNHFFRPFSAKEDFISLLSGHTTVAFTLSSVLAARIKNPWASIGLYGLAGATSISRVYSRDHWLSDVVLAAAFSTCVGNSVVKWFEETDQGDASTGFLIQPTINGVTVVWKF